MGTPGTDIQNLVERVTNFVWARASSAFRNMAAVVCRDDCIMGLDAQPQRREKLRPKRN